MKILKMRATFGKLQSAELALGEGLNVIEAPNEGGKSTWSAFLRAMLYGINTKERDRQGYLAEKNRYQPWSGAAMEGSVELLWQGRSVTLRRGPKGSTPFGRFEAVYTGTAELVPGLTGDNAGETLTGVPREVFERSAFVGQGGAAIDGAPALEARIAALASSGEEDVSYSQVERRLRDWLNRRKHNKTGLIPRLEEELADVEETLARQSKAFRLAQEARRELERLQAEHRLLESERDAHLSRAMAQRRARWEAAQAALAEAQAQVDGLEAERTRHGAPPDRDTLKRAQEELNALNTLHANRKLAESQLEEAFALLKQAKDSGVYQAFVMDEVFQKMEGGNAAVAMYYAGDYLTMLENNEDLAFVVPEEGSNWFVDAMCILKSSQHMSEAEEWINFIASTKANLANMDYIWYASPNGEALEEYPAYYEEVNEEPLDPEIYEVMAPSEEVLRRCEIYENLPAETLRLYDRLWTRLGV